MQLTLTEICYINSNRQSYNALLEIYIRLSAKKGGNND